MGFYVFVIVAQIVLLNFLSILTFENIKAGRKASTVIPAIGIVMSVIGLSLGILGVINGI